MKITFLGVGAAFDEKIPNLSCLIQSEKTNLLLDCGFSSVNQLWKFNKDTSFLDAIYISHLHADHYFGIPPLFVRMNEDRTKPLTIICQKGSRKRIEEILEYGYKGFSNKAGFEIRYVEVDPENTAEFNDLKLSFALSEHPVSNMVIKVESDGKTVSYSGDGMFTQSAVELYKNSNLLIHEAFLLDQKMDGHACITDLIDMAEQNNIKCLALTHIDRRLRRDKMELIRETIKDAKIKTIIPNCFDEYVV